MSVATDIGRKTIRLCHFFVDTVVLIVVLLLFVVGCYAIGDSRQVYHAADASRYEPYKPTTENGGKTFAQLQDINPDVFAWLTVYGTHIDYPVVQGKDNMRYINTNAEGDYSLSGAIFLDYRNARDFSDFSSILYGHHMEKNAMFGEIGLFADRGYFSQREYGTLTFGGQEKGLEFFAFLHVDAYDSSVFTAKHVGQQAQEAYLDALLQKATHTRELQVTTNDRIVLLSTCSSSSTNGRDILVGKITDEVVPDPFKTNDTGKGASRGADRLFEFWASLPGAVRVALIAAIFLILLLLMSLLIERRRRKKRAHLDPKYNNSILN